MGRGQVAERVVAERPTGKGRGILRAYYELTKPRIVLLMLITAYAAMWIASDTAPDFVLTLLTLAGTALSAGSANALNCYIDRDIDAIMTRTQKRPIPSGRLQPHQALWFGIITGVLSVVLLAWFVNPLAAFWAAAGILFYVFVYTLWLKRSTPQNIVIGGAAGAVPPLIGWAAVTGTVEIPAVLLFLIIFMWTPPHFWALALFRSQEYAKVNVPMMPVVYGEDVTKRQILIYTILLVIITLLLTFTGATGWFYFAAALVAGLVFVYRAYETLRAPSGDDKTAKRLYIYSVFYLGIVFIAAVLDRQ